MKTKTLFTMIFVTITFANVIAQKHTDLVGQWTGSDIDNNKSDMIFTKDGFISFTIDNQVLGGENFLIKGQKADLKYEIDSSKNPIWIDLVGYLSGEKIEKGRLKGIVRFIDNENADILISFDNVRFENFTEENKKLTIRITRKK